MRDRLMNQPTTPVYSCFPRIAAYTGSTGDWGDCGVIGASSSLALVTLQIQQSMMQLLRLLVASLGARRSSIGRARARLHTLYTARGMAGDCTRMACEGVLKYVHYCLCVYVPRHTRRLTCSWEEIARPVPQLFL